MSYCIHTCSWNRLCAKKNTYISERWVLIKTQIVMLFEFTNAKISNNHKLFPDNNFSLWKGKFTRPLPLCLLFFLKTRQNSNIHPFVKWESEGDPAMINQSSLFCSLLVKERIQGKGYNSRRYSCWALFCIKTFNSNELCQISHDCKTKSVRHRQIFFVKFVSKNY